MTSHTPINTPIQKPNRVFISHASEDRDFVEREIISLLTIHEIEVWYAKKHVPVASYWETVIVDGLKSCDWFLVVLSPNSISSTWVRAELNWAFKNRLERIVPVIIEDCHWDEFNLQLLTVQNVDFIKDLNQGKSCLMQTWGIETGEDIQKISVSTPPKPKEKATPGTDPLRLLEERSAHKTAKQRGDRYQIWAGLLGLLLIITVIIIIIGYLFRGQLHDETASQSPEVRPQTNEKASDPIQTEKALTEIVDLQLASSSRSKPEMTSTTKYQKPPESDANRNLNSSGSRGFEGTMAGDRKELVTGIFFRWCPAGEFTMGSPKSELGRFDDENQVSVTLTRGIWLGETEVTQGQWEKLMGKGTWQGKIFKEGIDFAATFIKHDDAVDFCKKLTSQERATGKLPKGWKYSLPTEAQWEYACRAGTTTKYSFGSDESNLSQYGWWGGFEGEGNAKDEKYAHGVGLKRPNAWGLKDMHGNAYEWCSDWYGDKLQGGRDPQGSSSGSNRVRRGGSWNFNAVYCRSADRGNNSPGGRGNILGFRLAAVPE